MTRNWRNDGRRFEKELEIICTKYAGNGWMRLKKVEQPIKTFGPPQARCVIHLLNPYLDAVGTWTERGGRMVTFEAKSTIKPQLRLGDGGLSANQMTNIHLWDHAGAVTFLLWEFKGVCRLWDNAMIATQSKLAKHLKFENGLMVPMGDGFLIYDFRQLMVEHWV